MDIAQLSIRSPKDRDDVAWMLLGQEDVEMDGAKKPHFQWQRFWCPRTGTYSLADAGYLLDPLRVKHLLSVLPPSDAVPFSAIEATQCLILLGEPGIGKSDAMREVQLAPAAIVSGIAYERIVLDLKDFGSEDRLSAKLFGHSAFQAWANHGSPMELCLDSLDECLLRVPVVMNMIVAELKQYPMHSAHLRVRIACRTAEWPVESENDLLSLWKNDGAVGVYELVPLRRCDVMLGAKGYGIEPDAFIAEVDRAGAVALAIKPVTLLFLLKTFHRDKSLPRTQVELYRAGCQLLCEEMNPFRRRSRDLLTSEQRVLIASRLAAAMVFCNRSVIYFGPSDAPGNDSILHLSDVIGGIEGRDPDPIQVDLAVLREVLETGLFTSRGPDLLGWAHQTYAEFLASEYVRRHDASVPQMMSLIQHPGGTKQIIPQLHEVSAWIANHSSALREQLLYVDPLVLLRSDVSAADERTREMLTATLLTLIDREEIIHWDYSMKRYYQKLSHAGLSDQLAEYISDRTKSQQVRRFAVDVAHRANVKSLLPNLIGVALDQRDEHSMRVYAAHAAGELDSAGSGANLLPLARGAAGEDPDDELKGCGLRASWPRHLPSEELFGLVTFPKQWDLHGIYYWFLTYELVERLPDSDLGVALLWASRQEYRHTALDPIVELADKVICAAWDAGIDGPLLPLFADAAISRFRQGGPIMRRQVGAADLPLWEPNDPRRLGLLREVVSRAKDNKFKATEVFYSKPPLAISSDTPWLIQRLREATEAEADGWVQMVWSAFGQSFDHLDQILDAMDIPAMRRSFGKFLTPVPIDSPEASHAREELRRHKEERRRFEVPLLDPPPPYHIEQALKQCDGGSSKEGWLALVRSLALTQWQGSHLHDTFNSDLRTLPGWVGASSDTRGRVIVAAKHYLASAELGCDDWFATNSIPWTVMAEYRAIVLVANEKPEWLYEISTDAWRRWARLIIGLGTLAAGDGFSEQRKNLIARVYAADSELFMSLVLQQIDATETSPGCRLWMLDEFWDTKLQSALVEKLGDCNLPTAAFVELLEKLLEKKDKSAIAIVNDELSKPVPTGGPEKQRFESVAWAAVKHAPRVGWPVIWKAIESDESWGRSFLERIAGMLDHHGLKLGAELPESAAKDVFEWLIDRFPAEQDPPHRGMVSGRQSIASFRDGLLSALQQRGNVHAVAALAELSERRPELRQVRWALLSARQNLLKRTWLPPSPMHVINLLRTSESRLIQNGEHLLDAIIESLQRWEAKLQGTPPAAFQLWDMCRPKSENKMSDAVTLHLRDDIGARGIIANREIVIRPGEKPAGIGERTDVLVQTFRRGLDGQPSDLITVTIETKGCWNVGLFSAMKSQLCDRYLLDNECRHGLYLVGWYVCPQWDTKDPRYATTPKMTRGEVSAQLERQARGLTVDDVVIKSLVVNSALR